MSNSFTSEEIAEYVDLTSGLARVGGNVALFKRMLDLFSKGGEYDAFDKALEISDINAASEAMHSIKGISGNLSLTRLYKVSSELTNGLRKGVADDNLINEYREILEKTRLCVDQVAEQL